MFVGWVVFWSRLVGSVGSFMFRDNSFIFLFWRLRLV